MTVTSSTASSGPFVGNGSTTVFPFGFDIALTSEVKVVVDGVTVTTGFTVAISTLGTGGTVTFTSPPGLAAVIYILSAPDFLQDIDFQNNGPFLTATFDEVADRAAIRDIYLKERIDAIYPQSAAIGADRAGKYIAFDGSGDPVFSTGTGADAGLRTDLAANTGGALTGEKLNAPNAVALNLHEYIEDNGSYNIMGFVPQSAKSAIRDRTSTVDLDTHIANAMAAILSERGGGTLRLPPGKFNLASFITGLQGVGVSGAGSKGSLIYARGTADVFRYGTGTTGGDADFERTVIENLAIIGTATSGKAFWGRKATTAFQLRNLYIEKGNSPVVLDSCYSLFMENVQVRAAETGDNIALNSVSHDVTLIHIASQIAKAGAGLSIAGCYTPRIYGGKFEFNQRDQIRIDSGRGISIRDAYIEGIQPTASTYAGIHVVAADTVNISGGLFDATQSGPMGTNGTGTYVKVSGASSRVTVRDYGFVSIAGTQTHVNFGATADNCEAVVPAGATTANSTPSRNRIIPNVADNQPIIAVSSAGFTLTHNAYTALSFATEVLDPLHQWVTNTFMPRATGVYTISGFVQCLSLAAASQFNIRLRDTSGGGTDVAQVVNYLKDAGSPSAQFDFTELLTAGKPYQVQLYLLDGATTNRATSTSEQSNRICIERKF